jgi:hypothetical protein
VLDLVDEALHQVALLVQVLVILSLLLAIRARRDDRLYALGFDSTDQRR